MHFNLIKYISLRKGKPADHCISIVVKVSNLGGRFQWHINMGKLCDGLLCFLSVVCLQFTAFSRFLLWPLWVQQIILASISMANMLDRKFVSKNYGVYWFLYFLQYLEAPTNRLNWHLIYETHAILSPLKDPTLASNQKHLSEVC